MKYQMLIWWPYNINANKDHLRNIVENANTGHKDFIINTHKASHRTYNTFMRQYVIHDKTKQSEWQKDVHTKRETGQYEI